MSLDDRLARVALGRLAEPGDPRMSALVAELGASRVHEHLAAERDLGGMLSDVAARLAGLDPAADLARAESSGLRFVVPGEEEWPVSLDDLAGAAPLQERGGVPLGLWVRGPVRLDALADSVAVVGSRSATSYGASVAGEIGATLAGAGLATVSGAAFGIDQAAHRGALAGRGPTVAVLACGADRVYPTAHRQLIDYVAQTGAVVSEVPPGGAPMRVRFLARNRIIAGLGRATVVVEAAARSGALNTANWADRLHRSVLGVPGPVTSAQSQGVHHLVRSGLATLVTGGADVLEMVGAAGDHLTLEPRGREHPRDRLTRREAQVLDAVPVHRPAAADAIARTSGIGLVEVGSALLRLRHRDLVVQEEGGWVLTASAAT